MKSILSYLSYHSSFYQFIHNRKLWLYLFLALIPILPTFLSFINDYLINGIYKEIPWDLPLIKWAFVISNLLLAYSFAIFLKTFEESDYLNEFFDFYDKLAEDKFQKLVEMKFNYLDISKQL